MDRQKTLEKITECLGNHGLTPRDKDLLLKKNDGKLVEFRKLYPQSWLACLKPVSLFSNLSRPILGNGIMRRELVGVFTWEPNGIKFQVFGSHNMIVASQIADQIQQETGITIKPPTLFFEDKAYSYFLEHCRLVL